MYASRISSNPARLRFRASPSGHEVLITGATGETGGVAVRESIKRGLDLHALMHSKDV
jgi:hypothetical protein